MKSVLPVLAGGMAMVAFALPATAAPAAEAPLDMHVAYRWILPDKSEDWDSAQGCEVQVRFWGPSGLGVGIGAAFDAWEANEEAAEAADEYGYVGITLDGDATVVPMGASLLYRQRLGPHAVVLLEAGLRYVFVDSDIETVTVIQDAAGAQSSVDKVDIDNSVLGTVGVAIETGNDAFWLRIGMGYQFDLTEPEETWAGQDIGETSFEAALFTIGLGWSF